MNANTQKNFHIVVKILEYFVGIMKNIQENQHFGEEFSMHKVLQDHRSAKKIFFVDLYGFD